MRKIFSVSSGFSYCSDPAAPSYARAQQFTQVNRTQSTQYAVGITERDSAASAPKRQMRRDGRRGSCAARRVCNSMLDLTRTADDAVAAQRRAAVHGDGRDGGGGADRGRGRPSHPHGGRPAGGAGAVDRDRGGAGGARRRRGSAIPRRSASRSLRARIARHYREHYGIDVDPGRVVVTTGSSAGFILAFLALFEPGDRVAVACPGYPPYRHILTALGCEPVLIETSASNRWAITAGGADRRPSRARRSKGVLVASPANPTGTMMTAEALARADRRGGRRGHPLHLRRDLSRPRLRVSGARPRAPISAQRASSSTRSRNISA